jgi:hypothetical protein
MCYNNTEVRIMEIKQEIKIIEFIEYDGIRFYRDQKGYWLSQKASRKDYPKRLHIYVWEKYNGPVPEGYHIHHIDHNTDNNEIENLRLMEKFKHLQYHSRLQNKEVARRNLSENARPKANEWHGSEEGIQWHKEQYQKTKDKLHKKILVKCIVCGKETEKIDKGGRNKYCSDKCKNKDKKPVLKEERTCCVCGNKFMTSIYSKASSCTRKCSQQLRKDREQVNK